MTILNRSNISFWREDQINTAPDVAGVYVLRNFPSANGIIYIGSAGKLKERLIQHYQTSDIPEVLFFDWYQTESIEDAQNLEREWISQYSPKYNYRVG